MKKCQTLFCLLTNTSQGILWVPWGQTSQPSPKPTNESLPNFQGQSPQAFIVKSTGPRVKDTFGVLVWFPSSSSILVNSKWKIIRVNLDQRHGSGISWGSFCLSIILPNKHELLVWSWFPQVYDYLVLSLGLSQGIITLRENIKPVTFLKKEIKNSQHTLILCCFSHCVVPFLQNLLDASGLSGLIPVPR